MLSKAFQNLDSFYHKNFSQVALITAIKMTLACILAFFSYSFFDLQYGSWAVITVAAITQAGFTKTLTKSLMRLLGTLVGAIVGYALALLAHGNTELVLLFFFIFIVISSYFAIQPTDFSYGGVVAGLTMAIILSSSLFPGELFGTAVYRTIEVVIGIVAVTVVNLLLGMILKTGESITVVPTHLKQISHEFKKFEIQRHYLKAAIKIALACLITSLSWAYLRQPQGFWATISCLLIMEESAQRTQLKSMLRFLAHIIAALIGAACAFLLGDHIMWRLVPLAIGFFACGLMIGSEKSYASLGNTTGIALAIMLLGGSDTVSTLDVIALRFVNVIFGITVAILITRYLWPSSINKT